MISSEQDLHRITQEKLVKTFAKVHDIGDEAARQVLDEEPYIGAAIHYDDMPFVKPPKYLEKVIGRFYGRNDIRIRFVEIGQKISTVVVGLAVTINDGAELVLFPDKIAHFEEEVLYDSVLHINHESGETYMNSFKSADVVRQGEQAPFSTHVRRIPPQIIRGFNGILSRTSPEHIDI